MIDYELLAKIFPRTKDAKRWDTYLQSVPVPKKPIVTKSDARNKFLSRYFVRNANDKTTITEVDKIQYYSFGRNPRFVTTELTWKIIGKKQTEVSPSGIVDRGVEDYNRRQVQQKDLTFGGLSDYITDYTEFWVSET